MILIAALDDTMN